MDRIRVFIFCLLGVLSACSTPLKVSHVSYQSVFNGRSDLKQEVPEDAKICAVFSIDKNGHLEVGVYNLTESIMKIDRTKSFFVNSEGTSKAFYDPNVRMESTTVSSSTTNSQSVNLGAIALAAGIGGSLGTALSGISTGSAVTNGTSQTNSLYSKDQQIVAIAPRGHMSMGGSFKITCVGTSHLEYSIKYDHGYSKNSFVLKDNPSFSFSVVITYSTDDGNTYDTLESSFYSNEWHSPVIKHGNVNDALRKGLSEFPDALIQPWFIFYAMSDAYLSEYSDFYVKGALYDYK